MGTRARLYRRYFNPPTPCGVGHIVNAYGMPDIAFQSTHPVRGGTDNGAIDLVQVGISIHPPRAGWDGLCLYLAYLVLLFQSTHPVRGGTCLSAHMRKFVIFQSTHPVRGGTARLTGHERKLWLFQSTHPVRGGTLIGISQPPYVQFQSTHPVRGGTNTTPYLAPFLKISIHPPRAGWD